MFKSAYIIPKKSAKTTNYNSTIQMNNSTKPQMAFHPLEVLNVGEFKGDRTIPTHAHTYAEIVYVVEGECKSRFGNGINTKNCSAGMAFIIPPHLTHDQRGNAHTIYVAFEPPDDLQFADLAIVDLQNDNYIRRWIEDLFSIWISGERSESNALANAIILRCKRYHLQQETMPKPQAVRFIETLNFISNNFQKPLTAQKIAQHVNCSINTLNAYFHKQFNQSMMAYLYAFRLGIARQLLQNDYLSIKEIADRSGFADVNYFIRAFKKRFGNTPGRIRK